MTQDLLATIGAALYGPHWIAPLADALGINVRTLQRWANGQFVPSGDSAAGLLADMRKLLVARGRELERVVREIDRAAGKL